jgi:hypothetical protein
MYIAVSNDMSLPSTMEGSRYPVRLLFGGRTVAMMEGRKKNKTEEHEADKSSTCGVGKNIT